MLGPAVQQIENLESICVGRFIYGLGTGGFSVVVTRMIDEVCPSELLGELGIINNSAI